MLQAVVLTTSKDGLDRPCTLICDALLMAIQQITFTLRPGKHCAPDGAVLLPLCVPHDLQLSHACHKKRRVSR